MARIGFIQHRLGRTDGVSLEVDKFRSVLQVEGHEVFYLSGNADVPGGNFIPELHPEHPVTARIIRNATRSLVDYPNGDALIAEVRLLAKKILPGIVSFIRSYRLDVIFPNNLLSVGYNLPGMLALTQAIEETGVQSICHCHDFWWEESGEVYPTCREVIAFYEQYAPPAMDGMIYFVINRLAQKELLDRRGLPSIVVPNVFDFDQSSWAVDGYNKDFRDAIGVGESDLVFLQATRVLDRKGIEFAIDLIAELNQSRVRKILNGSRLYDGRVFNAEDKIVLVCAGYVETLGISGSYAVQLEQRAKEKNVDIRWVADQVGHSRSIRNGRKVYSLWDTYTAADFVTYPSVWEGWGNQLIEAFFARLPVVLFKYPVYLSDLEICGFDVVSLGSNCTGGGQMKLRKLPEEVVSSAALNVVELLTDPVQYQKVVDHNFAVSAANFGFPRLKKILKDLSSTWSDH
ncbi:MAG: glycosyltransferase family 4 protein [Opitutales bacterium]|nr:glycosyltransferase family 4 protein [Opitutales bacterium]